MIVVPGLAGVEMRETTQPVYDRPFEIADLYEDEDTEHYLIRYPEGLRGRPHTHSAAHTMVVLEGALIANKQRIGPGSYVHFPAGEVMQHEPAPGSHCLFVLIFHGAFDVQPA